MNLFRHSVVLSTQRTRFEALAFKEDLEQNLAKIAGWGYEGVELAIRDPDLVEVEKLVEMLDEHGLSVPAIGTGQAWGEERLSFTSEVPEVRRAAIERIKRHIPLAKQLNALVIIGLIRGMTPKSQTHTQSMFYLETALRECLGYATQAGVRLVLEPISRQETDLVNTVAQGMQLLGRIQSDHLGLLLDTYHMNIEENSIEESIRLCGKDIFHFHVADSNRRYPGAGDLDFRAILSALSSTGFQGWVSGEFMPGPDEAARLSIVFLKSINSSEYQ
jgi:5-keto-L-gluconate epimerase